MKQENAVFKGPHPEGRCAGASKSVFYTGVCMHLLDLFYTGNLPVYMTNKV